MRQETRLWLEQAQHDLEVAFSNLAIGLFDVVLVYCQQAIEKGLKALYIEQTGMLPREPIRWKDWVKRLTRWERRVLHYCFLKITTFGYDIPM